LIGSQFRNQLYHGYGIREESFQKIEMLVGYPITTIPYPFSEAKTHTDYKLYKPKHKELIHLRIHSMLLVQELERLGLKCGNKVTQQVGVPNWIQNNTSYTIACVRGLIDTDGYL